MAEPQSFKEKMKLNALDKTFPWKGKEKEYNSVLLERVTQAKNQRRQSLRRFDDLTFDQDYVANEDAINAYLRPKKNDDEVRVVTGTTEKKVEVVVNELLSYNFQHEVFAFDKQDLEVQELGDDMGDMVTRTNEMEQDEDLRVDALFELIGQRAVFVEEYLEEKMTNNMLIKRCKKRLYSGLQVFLGDINLPFYRFNEQPYIVIYDKMNYWTAKSLFGHNKNFDYVMPGMDMENDWYGGDFNWRLANLSNMQVEIIKYQSAFDNELQWWINGVPMEEFGTKLPWEHEGYNMVMSVAKRTSSNLAYGRPLTSSLKYLQGLKDETIRNLIRKFRQAVNPPKGVSSTGKIYSKDILEAGKITYGIGKDVMHNLVDHNGLTNGDTAMLEIINQIADEFASSSAQNQGIKELSNPTATQIIEQKKAAVKMLGLIVYGWTRVIKQLTMLRIYNLIENFTEPEGKEYDAVSQVMSDVYAKFTLKNATLSSEKEGNKIIQFNDRSLTPDEEDGLLEFEQQQEQLGNPTEVKFVNAKILRTVPITWYVVVTPKPKEDSALHQLMFADKFKQGSELSVAIGEPLNPSKWKQEYESTWRMKDAFAKPMNMPMQIDPETGQPMQPEGMGDMGRQAAAGSRAGARKPSMTAMLNAN